MRNLHWYHQQTQSWNPNWCMVKMHSCLSSELWHYSMSCSFAKKRLSEWLISNQKIPIPVPNQFKQRFILKFQDQICLKNILFVSKPLNDLSPSVFNTWFTYETSISTQGNHLKLFYKTNSYWKYSIIALGSHKTKSKNNWKTSYLKIYPPIISITKYSW